MENSACALDVIVGPDDEFLDHAASTDALKRFVAAAKKHKKRLGLCQRARNRPDQYMADGLNVFGDGTDQGILTAGVKASSPRSR